MLVLMVPVFAAPTTFLGRHKAHSKRDWERPVSSSGPCQLLRAGGSGSRRAIHKPSLTSMRGQSVFFCARLLCASSECGRGVGRW